MPLPISPAIPLSDYTETINVQGSLLQPWFNSGEIKALTDLLTAYHDEYYDPDAGGGTPVDPNPQFTEVQNIIIDIDPANADNGITDPYLFKDVIPAYQAAFSLCKRMSGAFKNTMTLLFADGDYSITELNENFLIKEPNPSTWEEGSGFVYTSIGSAMAEANCQIRIKAKNSPAIISSGSWTPVTTSATYDDNALWGPIAAANRAVVEAAFNVRFYFDIETSPYPYGSSGELYQYLYTLKIPSNAILDGVAFINPAGVSDPGPDYYGYYYVDIAGARGADGYAIVGTYGGYSSGFRQTNDKYAVQEENIDVGAYGSYILTKPVYIVDGGITKALNYQNLTSENGVGYTDVDTSDVLVNTWAGINIKDRAEYTPKISGQFSSRLTCIGVTYTGYAFIYFYTSVGISFFAHSSSSAPSGCVLFDFTENYFDKPLSGATSYLRVPNASKQFTGVSIRATRGEPVILRFGRGVYEGRFTGGLIGNWISYNQNKAMHFTGSGSPQSVVVGDVGDLYSNTSGGANTTLWVKESGNNTNTGWVAK